jgi:hypothetical protein
MNTTFRNFTIRFLNSLYYNFSSYFLGRILFELGLILWTELSSFKSRITRFTSFKPILVLQEFEYELNLLPISPLLLGIIFIDLTEQTSFKDPDLDTKLILTWYVDKGIKIIFYKGFLITPTTNVHEFIKHFLPAIKQLENKGYTLTQFESILIGVINMSYR